MRRIPRLAWIHWWCLSFICVLYSSDVESVIPFLLILIGLLIFCLHGPTAKCIIYSVMSFQTHIIFFHEIQKMIGRNVRASVWSILQSLNQYNSCVWGKGYNLSNYQLKIFPSSDGGFWWITRSNLICFSQKAAH